jgi:hypothetical protein
MLFSAAMDAAGSPARDAGPADEDAEYPMILLIVLTVAGLAITYSGRESGGGH